DLVTGVQTCALPISRAAAPPGQAAGPLLLVALLTPGRQGRPAVGRARVLRQGDELRHRRVAGSEAAPARADPARRRMGLFVLEEIGRASCRERRSNW